MTHSEDVIRVSTDDTVDFLIARIQAMEKRIKYLEAVIEVEILNKQQ
jgi:hypothetical protein